MAKKVVQEVPVKKKKHGCRNCFLTLLVIVVLFNVAAFFVGDYFVKRYTDMGLVDYFMTAWDLRVVNRNKLVVNGYTDSDLTKFENSVKKQLFLNEDAPFETSDFMDTLLSQLKGGEEQPPEGEGEGALTQAVHILNASGAVESTDGFVGYLGSLLVRENMDLQRLADYDESRHEEYILTLTDRELAAAINLALNALIDNNADLQSTLADFGVEKFSDVAALEQVILQAQTIDGTEIPVLKATLSVNLRRIANASIRQSGGPNLSFLVNMVLPKRAYVTAQVSLRQGVTLPQPLYINNMNDKKMDRIYGLIKGVSKNFAEEPFDLKEKLNESIGGYMDALLEKSADYIRFDNAAKHSVNMDLFDTVLSLSGINEGKEDPLTAPDLINTLAGVVASDADNAIDGDHAYDHQYVQQDGSVAYQPARTDTENLVDYRQEFMNEVADKYLLNLQGDPDDPSDDITFDSLLAMLGVTTDSAAAPDAPELLDLFDKSRLKAVLDLPDEQLAVQINDRMMGAILSSQIDSLITEGSQMAALRPKLEYVLLCTRQEHNLLQAALSLKLDGLLSDAGDFGGIINNLVGDKVVITVMVDVTITDDPEFAYLPATLFFNDCTAERTQKILHAINKIGGDFSVDDIISSLETPLRQGIDAMRKVLPIVLQDSSTVTDASRLPAAVRLPSLFDTIDTMLFADDPDEAIDADGIRAVLQQVCLGDDETYVGSIVSRNPAAENYEAFQNEIKQKYYIKDDVPLDFDALFVGNNKIINPDTISQQGGLDNFNITGTGGLVENPDYIDQRPLFFDHEIARMIHNTFTGEYLFDGGFDVVEFTILPDETLRLVLELDIAGFVTSGLEDKLNLLPATRVFVTALVTPVAEGEGEQAYYPTTLQINDMSAETFGVFNAMVSSLNGGAPAIDFAEKQKEIGRLICQQFSALAASLKQDRLTFASGVAADGKTHMGLQLPSYMDFIKAAIPELQDLTKEQLIAALALRSQM